jgi:hypothetical protein
MALTGQNKFSTKNFRMSESIKKARLKRCNDGLVHTCVRIKKPLVCWDCQVASWKLLVLKEL